MEYRESSLKRWKNKATTVWKKQATTYERIKKLTSLLEITSILSHGVSCYQLYFFLKSIARNTCNNVLSNDCLR